MAKKILYKMFKTRYKTAVYMGYLVYNSYSSYGAGWIAQDMFEEVPYPSFIIHGLFVMSQGPQTIYWSKNNTKGFADNRVDKEWYMGTPFEPCSYGGEKYSN